MKSSIDAPQPFSLKQVAMTSAVIAALLLGFSLVAQASVGATPVAPAGTDPMSLLGLLLTGHYLPAIGGGLVIVVGLLRSGGSKLWPWLGTKLGGYALAYVTAYALYLGTAWQAGAAWDVHLLVTAFGAALMASGVLDHWRDVVGAVTGSGGSDAAKTSSAAIVSMVILGCCCLAALGGASCGGTKAREIESAVWNCTAPERAEAVAAVTPAVVSVIKAAGSADGKLIDLSTVQAAISKANLLTEAGVLLSCALASAVAILEAPTPAPAPGAPAAAPYVLDPAAVAKVWAEIDAKQLGGARFQVGGGKIL